MDKELLVSQGYYFGLGVFGSVVIAFAVACLLLVLAKVLCGLPEWRSLKHKLSMVESHLKACRAEYKRYRRAAGAALELEWCRRMTPEQQACMPDPGVWLSDKVDDTAAVASMERELDRLRDTAFTRAIPHEDCPRNDRGCDTW